MSRWGVVLGLTGSLLVAPIVTAAPAQAVCVRWIGFSQCATPTTSPPAPPSPTPPVTSPPVTAPPVTSPPPAPDPYIDPDQAATEFFDAANAARAAAGLPAFGWRSDVASMAVAHSAEMAQNGSIWHGSFVSSANLQGLNASS